MMEVLKDLIKSKKFVNYAASIVITAGVAFMVQYGAFDEALATQVMNHLVYLFGLWVSAQGASDVAKALGKPKGVDHKGNGEPEKE